jgi:Zn-dependent protease with chaperone function
VLAKEANERYQAFDDPSYPELVAQLALGLDQQTEFRQATEILVQKYPNLMTTHYFNAIRLAIDESWIAAENEIKRAERLGLPSAAVQRFLDSGVHSRARLWHWFFYTLYLVTAWACGLFLLFAAGKLFPKLTLRFIDSADPNRAAGGAETALRQYYRRLINVAGYYYYLSIPFIILLVLGLSGSVTYGFLMLGHIPIKIVALLGIGAIVTVYQMVHSLFVRVNAEEPGRCLSLDEAPGLWGLTREVAQNLGTRPLDEIRVTPGTDMAVYERGSHQERREDRGRRILVMGLGLVPGLRQNPFRAVLAHEFGHLSHRDTAGGDVALRVEQDMVKFAYAMAQADQAVWWNIAFQFLRLYHFLFRRISHGASRLQEVLADRAATQIYGSQAFEEGLRHVIRRKIEFQYFARKEIEDALRCRRPLHNLYAVEMKPEKAIEDAIGRVPISETNS